MNGSLGWRKSANGKPTEESQESELRLVIGQLEEFARRVSEGVARAGLGDPAGDHPGLG